VPKRQNLISLHRSDALLTGLIEAVKNLNGQLHM